MKASKNKKVFSLSSIILNFYAMSFLVSTCNISSSDDKTKIKSSKNNTNSTNLTTSLRTNKNKQQPLPHKEKILDIISLDEPPKIDKTPTLEKSTGSPKDDEEEKINLNHVTKKNTKQQEKKKKILKMTIWIKMKRTHCQRNPMIIMKWRKTKIFLTLMKTKIICLLLWK